jgi:hypothetical protein
MATALAAGTLTTISVAAPSGAATKVTCLKETSKAPVTKNGTITVKITLTGCSASVGGKGSGVTTIKTGAKYPINKITWAKGKGTTTQQVLSYVGQKSRGKCKAGDIRLLITSKVTANTGAAAKVIKKGTIDKSYSCQKPDSSSYSEPGKKITF